MNVPSNDSYAKPLDPVLAAVRLGKNWRGKVLLQLNEGADSFGQHWPSVTAADWKNSISDPGQLFEQGAEVLKAGKNTMVVLRQLELGQNKVNVVCKLSGRRNALRRMIGVFRRSRASRNWQMGWDLLKEGIPTALPVGVLEKLAAGLRLSAIMITVSLLPGKSLAEFMRKDAAGLAAEAHRQLSNELVRIVGKLHKRGFFHRDLKGVNVFVQTTGQAKASLFLIDLDGCHHNGQSYRKRVKSLGRLARASLDWPTVKASDRLRFLKRYLAQSGQKQNDWKRWWRNIDGEVQRKLLMRKKRNGKRISHRFHRLH